LDEPNSAGGVSVNFNYKNLSNKTIKYLDWTGYPINAVGDAVTCSVRGNSSYSGRSTGPVKPNHYNNGGYWDCAWYCFQAKKMVLTDISIEYMDGSTLDISTNELKYIKGYKVVNHN